MYLIGYKLSSSRFWCLLYKTEKWGGMCRIGTEFFVYVFFCGWGRSPPRPSRARPTPSAGSPPQRPLPLSTNRCHPREGGDLLLFVERGSPTERHADENQHQMSLSEKNVLNGSMFAARGSLHAHTFTLFECSLSNDPLSAKKHERGSVRKCYCLVRVQRGYCSASREPQAPRINEAWWRE